MLTNMMFLKNLSFALRNFKKHTSASIINIAGLATGIAASLIIFMIAFYDTSYDKWEPDNKNIYRLYTYSGAEDINSGVTAELPEAIRNNISGVRSVTHYLSLGSDIAAVIPKADGHLQVFPAIQRAIFTDGEFFSIFPHRWLLGNPETSLKTPNRVVLSKSSALKFFPGKSFPEIIDKPIILGDSIQVTVSGIVDDLTQQSDFDFKVFLSYPTILQSAKLKNFYGWGQWGHVSYLSNCIVKLHDGADKGQIENQLKAIDFANNKPDPGMNGDEPRLLPLSSNHYATDIAGVVSYSTITNLGLVGLLILLLAIINYVNLSTSGATLRAKEVGVRKALGGNKKQIRKLFLTETFLLTFISTLIAVLITPLFIRGLGSYVPSGFSYKNVLNLTGFLYLGILLLLLTIAAGFYPALILARFTPGTALKGDSPAKGKSTSRVRNVLIISQFIIAQVLLVFVIIVSKQINYSLTKDLGYEHAKGIVSFYVPDAKQNKDGKKYSLIQQLERIKGVEKVSLSSALPTSSSQRVSVGSAIINGANRNFRLWTMFGDSNFVHLFHIPVVAGKNLRSDTASSLMPVLINETLSRQLGYDKPASAINAIFTYDGDKVVVQGVLNDFHINSLKSAIPPMLYYIDLNHASNVSLLLNGSVTDWHNTIGTIQKTFAGVYPNNAFNYHFFDQSIERLYRKDIAIAGSLKWATGLAIFISCIGLLGLVSFTANQRTKEIGIRKVLGASILQIIALLSKNLMKLVVLASVIAFPVAWYISRKWLEGFAFKTSLSWWVFSLSVVIMAILSFIVLCLRTYKAANANPVRSLKDE